ncbi:MAG: hypothetical protein H7Y22_03740 [Gemmatimonadaceae bacterium]|nr:hypothetical protein [Gloeobacterales cyanobacterium ES-bin-141]
MNSNVSASSIDKAYEQAMEMAKPVTVQVEPTVQDGSIPTDESVIASKLVEDTFTQAQEMAEPGDTQSEEAQTAEQS